MKRFLRLVEVLDELANAALVAEGVRFVFFPLVGERDFDAGVEEGQFAEAGFERGVGELGRLSNISLSGQNRIDVPLSSSGSRSRTRSRSPTGSPWSNDWRQSAPSRLTFRPRVPARVR